MILGSDGGGVAGPCPSVNSNPVSQAAERAADLSPAQPRTAVWCRQLRSGLYVRTWLALGSWSGCGQVQPLGAAGNHPLWLCTPSPQPWHQPQDCADTPSWWLGVLIGAGGGALGGGCGGAGPWEWPQGSSTDPERSANPKGPSAASPQTFVLPTGRTQPCRPAG